MPKRILFIGGEQDGAYNRISETKDKMELFVYPKIDFKNFSGIVTLNAKPIRKEIYHRRRFGDREYFCLEGLTDDKILAKSTK
jgi:hypothetical protein